MKRIAATLLALLLACHLAAQTVHVANYTNKAYRGWVPVSTAHASGLEPGTFDDVVVMPGRKVGKRGRMVHLRVQLDPLTTETYNLGQLQPLPEADRPRVPRDVAEDPLGTLGRPVLGGVALPLAELQPDGAGFVAHYRGRLTPMIQAELWTQWYPGQPWAAFEVLVIASNADRSDLGARLTSDLRLMWSPGHVQVRGQPIGQPLLPAGEWIGDGQGRAWTGTVIWTSRFTEEHWEPAGAWVEGPILSMGDWGGGAFGPHGYPAEVPTAFNVNSWFVRYTTDALAALHTWNNPRLGWARNSGDTGDQEDQGWTKGSEAFVAVGAWWPRYLATLSYIKRPCHHLEANGDMLDLDGHPDLVLGPGRVHWHTGVSPDRLGIPPGSRIDWHGWNGPDRQHWFQNTMGAARLLSGSLLVEYLLQHQAVNFWFNQTIDPRLSTSGPGADRGVGWTALTTCWILDGLDGDALRARIRQRAVDRLDKIIVPMLDRTGMTVTRWSVTDDLRVIGPLDQSLGYDHAWMAYQLAIGAGGLQILGEYLDHDGAQRIALQGARAVIDHGYTWNGDSRRWVEWDFVGERETGVPPPPQHYVEGLGAHRSGWFRHAWFPFAPWVVLRHDPNDPRARLIYDQIRSELLGGNQPLDWLPPLK